MKTNEEKKKSKRNKTDSPKKIYHGSLLRTMKIFGSEFRKKIKKTKRNAVSTQSSKSCPITTSKSVHTIYIASSGMNKRY